MPKVIVETANMRREDWLQWRKQGIGGSDASAIAGVNKYKSPIVTYMEKLGIYTPKPPGEAATWGNLLEPVVRNYFKKAINEERAAAGLSPMRVQQRRAIFAHDEHDFMRTNLDGLVFCDELGKGVLEIKTANQFLADDWAGDDIPNQYLIQVQHNIAVMNVNYAYVAALIGGQRYKHYFIPRDEEIIKSLIEIEGAFWKQNILIQTPPPVDGSDSTTEMMKVLYPKSYTPNPPIELDSTAKKWAELFEYYKVQEKEMETLKKEHANKLKMLLQENDLAYAGPHQIKWKADKNGKKTFGVKLNAI